MPTQEVGKAWNKQHLLVSQVNSPHIGHGSLLKLFFVGNFIYPNLPQNTQLQMNTNVVGKVPAMD